MNEHPTTTQIVAPLEDYQNEIGSWFDTARAELGGRVAGITERVKYAVYLEDATDADAWELVQDSLPVRRTADIVSNMVHSYCDDMAEVVVPTVEGVEERIVFVQNTGTWKQYR